MRNIWFFELPAPSLFQQHPFHFGHSGKSMTRMTCREKTNILTELTYTLNEKRNLITVQTQLSCGICNPGSTFCPLNSCSPCPCPVCDHPSPTTSAVDDSVIITFSPACTFLFFPLLPDVPSPVAELPPSPFIDPVTRCSTSGTGCPVLRKKSLRLRALSLSWTCERSLRASEMEPPGP